MNKIINLTHLYWINLKRNFLKEFFLGVGVILATIVLIIATTFGDGIERLHKHSILGKIPVNEIKIKGTVIISGIGLGPFKSKKKIYNIPKSIMTDISRISGVKDMIDGIIFLSEANFPVTLLITLKPPMGNRTFFAEPPIVGIPNRLVSQKYLSHPEIKKAFPNGFKRHGDVIPILIPTYIREIVNNFLKNNGLLKGSINLLQFKDLLDLKLMMNHSTILSKLKTSKNNQPIEILKAKVVGYTDMSITHGIAIPIDVLENVKNLMVKRGIFSKSQAEGYETAIIQVKKAEFIQPVLEKLSSYFKKNKLVLDKRHLSFRTFSSYIIDAVKSFKISVLVFSGLILFLSGLAIFYAFSYLIIRREKEIGLYRFFGGTKIQITIILLLEAAFIGILSASIGYLISYYTLTSFLPNHFKQFIHFFPQSILNIIFSSGGDVITQFNFQDIFKFNLTKNLFFAIISALSCVIAAFIPAVIGSSISLFKAIQRN